MAMSGERGHDNRGKKVNYPEIMGKYKNSKLQNTLLIISGVVITIAALAGGIGSFFGL